MDFVQFFLKTFQLQVPNFVITKLSKLREVFQYQQYSEIKCLTIHTRESRNLFFPWIERFDSWSYKRIRKCVGEHLYGELSITDSVDLNSLKLIRIISSVCLFVKTISFYVIKEDIIQVLWNISRYQVRLKIILVIPNINNNNQLHSILQWFQHGIHPRWWIIAIRCMGDVKRGYTCVSQLRNPKFKLFSF